MKYKFRVENNSLHVSPLLDPRTRTEAIKLSIRKWEKLYDALVATGTVIYDGSSDTCGLCNYNLCVSCPIFTETGFVDCGDTPYQDYADAYDAKDYDGCVIAAQHEIQFLKDLLRRYEAKEDG